MLYRGKVHYGVLKWEQAGLPQKPKADVGRIEGRNKQKKNRTKNPVKNVKKRGGGGVGGREKHEQQEIVLFCCFM